MRSLYSGYLVGKPDGGPECEAFERELERYYDVPYARVLNSATAALHAALVAVDVKTHDDVIVPAYSMSASASAIVHAGATPLFADIEDDYLMDWGHAERLTTEMLGAIVYVHLFGHHGDVPDDCPVPVVHDCAQAPTFRPNPTWSEDIWVYSLNQWKTVTCGEGGYILTFDRESADRVHAVRNHGECESRTIMGHNYRMTEMQAHVARNEFRQLDERINGRRAWALEFGNKHNVKDPSNRDFYLLPALTTGDREKLAERLGGKVGYHKPLYALPWFQAHGYKDVHLPNVERIEREIVTVSPLAHGVP